REASLDDPHPYLTEVLKKAQEISEHSNGAFDVTVQPLWKLYSAAEQEGRVPDESEIQSASQKVDWRKVSFTDSGIRIDEGMSLTLNGIAQGFASDRALAVIRDRGIRHALVDTGEIGALGRKPGKETWTVGIQHPRQKDAYLDLTKIEDLCMATSGDYSTTFSPDRAYTHIFDPATGRSPEALSSVTVLAPSGIDADGISTTVFVLGEVAGLRLLQSYPGTEAMVVKKNGEALYTDGFPRSGAG
ncbi:MAG: FAD:protein FMN transferase, partial [Planctomycetota bacterium]|nr:FAD:protein FMN transferase [Planctomycetota bacterium]